MSNLSQIRQAAVRLFAERGFAATGIRDIGRDVGLNSATLYHYTGGKEELLVGIMENCLEELLRVGRGAMERNADPSVGLARLVRAHVATEAINTFTARVTDREVHALGQANHLRIMSLRDDYESMFQQVLERGARTGRFRITDSSVTRLALLEMCNGVANWYRPSGRLGVAEVQDLLVELACKLVGSRLVVRDECQPDVTTFRLDSEPRGRDGRTRSSA